MSLAEPEAETTLESIDDDQTFVERLKFQTAVSKLSQAEPQKELKL